MRKPRKPGSRLPYTTGQIAEELGVHPSTVITMLVKRHEMPWHWSDSDRQTGRRLVMVKDWHEWLRRNGEYPPIPNEKT